MRRRIVAAAVGIAALSATLAAAAPGDLSLVSLSGGGTQGDQPADASAASADGRFVAFTSAANLTPTPVGAVVQLYVRDRVANTTTLASASATGAPASAAVEVENVGNVLFSISGNGRFAVFSTAASLTAADGDATLDVYRKDLQTGAVTLVSVNTAGQKANAAVFGDPDVSYDGRAVSFGSGATTTNLFAGDLNNASDIVVRDIAAGTTVLAAQSAAGVLANGTTERSAISADGHVVAFEAPTGTNNLLPGDATPTDFNDVVVRNLAAGTTAGASDPTAAAGSGFPDISGDGRYVVFETDQAYDPANDAAGKDVYRRDMTTGAFTLASAVDGGTTRGNGTSERAAIAADGSRVTFRSLSTDLVGADGNAGALDIYARDIAPRVTRRASARANGSQTTTDSDRGAVAGNGAVVTFVNSDAGVVNSLVASDVNDQPDVFAKEFAPSDTAPPVLTSSGATWRATDASGIGQVTVNGAPVAVSGGGAFSVPPVPVIDVFAVDGAGNATTARVVVPPTGPGAPVAPRAQRLKATLKGRKITVRFRLTADARVTVTLLRRTVRHKPKRRVVLTRVRRPLTKALKAGQRSVVLTLRRRPAAGRYVVRVRANAAGLVSTATTTLVVKPLTPKRR